MIEIYLNNGNCQFQDVTESVFPTFNTFVITQGNNRTWGGQVASSDYDHDGDVDLLLASWGDAAPPFSRYPGGASTMILRNDKKSDAPHGFILQALTTNPPLPENSASYVCPAVWEDFDEDGWDDIVLSSCGDVGPGPTFFWRNTRNAKRGNDGRAVPIFPNGPNNMPLTINDRIFVDVSNNIPPFGFYGTLSIGMSLSFGDLNNNLHGDFVLTNYGKDAPNSVTSGRTLPIFLFKSIWKKGKLTKYVDVGPALDNANDGINAFTNRFGWGDAFIDLDNDGFDDVIHNGIVPGLLGNPGLIFQNMKGRKLNLRQNLDLLNRQFTPHSVAHGDFNNDGFLDFVLGTGCHPTATGCQFRGDLLFINNGANIPSLNNRFFLDISLRGAATSTNFYGIGSLVQLKIFSNGKLVFIKNGKSRAGTNLASTSSNVVHFGWLKPEHIKKESLSAKICVRWNGKNSGNPQEFDVQLNKKHIISESTRHTKSCQIFKNPGNQNGLLAFKTGSAESDESEESQESQESQESSETPTLYNAKSGPLLESMTISNYESIKVYLLAIIVIGLLIFATMVLCLGCFYYTYKTFHSNNITKYVGVETNGLEVE